MTQNELIEYCKEQDATLQTLTDAEIIEKTGEDTPEGIEAVREALTTQSRRWGLAWAALVKIGNHDVPIGLQARLAENGNDRQRLNACRQILYRASETNNDALESSVIDFLRAWYDLRSIPRIDIFEALKLVPTRSANMSDLPFPTHIPVGIDSHGGAEWVSLLRSHDGQ